jgi:hypothetical protein
MAVVTALLTPALGFASCGGMAFTFSATPPRPLPLSVARVLCRAAPRLVSGSSTVLVPGHPTGALICRYSANGTLGSDRPRRLAGGVQVVKPDVIRHLVGELNALPPRPTDPVQSCPDFSGRSDLILFRYHGAGEARVQITSRGCVPVSNGRIERAGDTLHGIAETYWPDEGLL